MFKKVRYNLILYGLLALVVGLCTTSFFRSALPSVSLEQQVRCGIDPHIHTDDCYKGDILTCTTTAHVHDENCYLVLLKDNDINSLLHHIETAKEPTLEHMITDTVRYALRFNSNLTTEETIDTLPQLDRPAVEALNATLHEQEDAVLTLNEDLNTLDNLQMEESQLPPIIENVPSYLAVETPSSSYMRLNIYVYLDNSWQCIGDISYGYNNKVTTSTLMDHINTKLGSNLSSKDIKLYYSTDQQYNRAVTIANASQFTLSNTNFRAVHARVVPASATSNSSTDLAFYTVTFTYPDGTVEKQYVRAGATITLPSGDYVWNDGINDRAPGDQVYITQKTDFVAKSNQQITSVRITYDLSFPNVSNVTVTTKPTIAGYTGTTLTQSFSEGTGTVVADVSSRDVRASVNGNNTGLSRVIHFSGWRLGTSDTILSPNTSLLWEELVQYASGGTIRLYGVWESEAVQTASFFVRYDSVAVDTEGSTGGQDSIHYTNELFAAFVGGTNGRSYTDLEKFGIADTTSDNSFSADQAIRALYGADENEVWLTSFPTDAYIFEQLKSYAENKKLSIPTEDGGKELVDPADLNSNAYAIRWYVFKAQSDAWHIDGKLLKKEGVMQVSKTFAGNADLVNQAKKDFYIDAINDDGTKNHRLTLNNASSYDAQTDTYLWEIKHVDYQEPWTITEHSLGIGSTNEDFSVYSDFAVLDASGGQSRNEIGTSASVLGEIYELDRDDLQVLRVGFTNIYNRKNSIIIKKQDAATGNSLSGATFRLLQNDLPLTFTYDEETKAYQYDPNGTITVLSGNNNGYFELMVEDFSYSLGAVTVQEVTAPQGYTPSDDIVIGYLDHSETSIGILEGGSGMAVYQEGVLLVGNGASIADVTAQKSWDCAEGDRAPVTIQLLANGRLITHLLATVQPSVVLSAENHWSHTWEDLPTYIDGVSINYSLREIQIGQEQCKADYTFPNWIVSYDKEEVTFSSDGKTHIRLALTNTAKRVLLRVNKLNLIDHSKVAGAIFTLEELNANGSVNTNAIVKTMTSDENGILIFDNLKTGTRYRLTETDAPSGYYTIKDSIYLTIAENGTIAIDEHPYAVASADAYNITVYNQPQVALPESGGGGTWMYFALGLLLMLAASVYIYSKSLGKEVLR